MKDKKIFLFLFVGILFIIFGFILGRNSKENISNPKDYQKTSLKKSSNSPGVLPNIFSNTTRQEALITKAIDGDTIQTDTGIEIRYLGINSPEEGDPYFEEALGFNKNLVLNKKVTLELDIQEKDRFGRTLAYIFVDDKLVNLEMVKNGFAVTQTIQPNVKYQDQIVIAQKEARENCLGIWEGLCQESLGNKGSNCIQITSINADAKGNDNENKNGEWIEIGNYCKMPVSLIGWILKDASASNKYEFKNFSLETDKNVIVYSGCGQDYDNKLYWKCPEGKYAIWNNAGDHAFLYNEKGDLVSDYQY